MLTLIALAILFCICPPLALALGAFAVVAALMGAEPTGSSRYVYTAHGWRLK